MEIIWHGQSCFTVKTKTAVLVFDPYDPGTGLKLPKLKADIVLVSHDHPDHNNVAAVESLTEGEKKPFVISGPGEYEIKDLIILGVFSFHDDKGGAERGTNTMYVVRAEDINLCHLGDLGQILSDEQLEKLNGIDILLIPVGGTYTLDTDSAIEVINQIEPKIVIPMHYQIEGLTLPLDSVDVFAKQEGIDSKTPQEVFKITKQNLPEEERETIILTPKKR